MLGFRLAAANTTNVKKDPLRSKTESRPDPSSGSLVIKPLGLYQHVKGSNNKALGCILP